MAGVSRLLPETIGGRYNIYLWSQPLHVLGKVRNVLCSGSCHVEESLDNSVVKLIGVDIANVIETISNTLSRLEQAALKILLFEGDAPSVTAFGAVISFDQLLKSLEGQWVVGLLKEGRYKSVIQPIVSADDPTRIYAYEFLLRGLDQDGKVIAPVDLFKAATHHNILPTLDHVARHSAVTTAAQLGITEKLFINFTPAAIFDPAICLQSTLEAITAHGFRPEDVVFEIVESEVVADMPHLCRIVEYCRAEGFKLALDDFGAGFNNLGTYLDLKPDYIKIDRQLTDRMIGDSHRREMVGGFIASAQRNGAKIIAEGIEDETAADILTGMGVDYLQGYYYGRPADRPMPISMSKTGTAKTGGQSV